MLRGLGLRFGHCFDGRQKLDENLTRATYGFLYNGFKPNFYWWATRRALIWPHNTYSDTSTPSQVGVCGRLAQDSDGGHLGIYWERAHLRQDHPDRPCLLPLICDSGGWAPWLAVALRNEPLLQSFLVLFRADRRRVRPASVGVTLQTRWEPSTNDGLNRLDELSLLTLVITFLLGTRTLPCVIHSFPAAPRPWCRASTSRPHGAGLLLQSLKSFDALNTGQDSVIAVAIALAHFFYVGYFFWRLLVACVAQWPDVFEKLYPLHRRPSLCGRGSLLRCMRRRDGITAATHHIGALADENAIRCRLGKRVVRSVAAQNGTLSENNGAEGVIMTELGHPGGLALGDRDRLLSRALIPKSSACEVEKPYKMRDAFIEKHRQVLITRMACMARPMLDQLTKATSGNRPRTDHHANACHARGALQEGLWQENLELAESLEHAKRGGTRHESKFGIA